MDTVTLHAKGKLLLTGEYAVLDGAAALALPTRQGQQLTVVPGGETGRLRWSSTDMNGVEWFSALLSLSDFSVVDTNNTAVAQRLSDIFRVCQSEQPGFLPADGPGISVRISADFPLDWGLGSSSTLIALVAKWANINPYLLLERTFGGSGYDIACAFADGPIVYQRPATGYDEHRFRRVSFAPAFADQLYFVYLGQKQNSREGIQRYRDLAPGENHALVERITDLTNAMLTCSTLPDFEAILAEHEALIGQTLQLPRVKDTLFRDYPGSVKSLGAWGGDFVLVTSEQSLEQTQKQWKTMGYEVCVGWREMLL